MNRIVLALLLCSALLLCALPSHACSCIGDRTPTEMRDASDLVVAGRVTQIQPHPDGWDLIVSFVTHAVWKGPFRLSYQLRTAQDGAACGYSFVVGEEYFVYADEDNDGYWFTHLCGRNAPLHWADEDIDELGPPLVVSTSKASFGMVKARFEAEGVSR